jgi:hypothetical protein
MAKYHINGRGEPGKCSAQKGGCPFGGEGQHYSTSDDARKAYETVMSSGGDWESVSKSSANPQGNEAPQTGSPTPGPDSKEMRETGLPPKEWKHFTELREELARVSTIHRNHGFPEDEMNNYNLDKKEGELRKEFEVLVGDSAGFEEIKYTVTSEDRMAGIDQVAATLGSVDRKYSWESVMGSGTRQTKNSIEKYRRNCYGIVRNDPELSAKAEDFARENRDANVWARAYDRGAPIPKEMEAEFEKIWTTPSSPGSEHDLRATLEDHRDLESKYGSGQISATKIVGGGMRNPKRAAEEYLDRTHKSLERALETRGRSNALNVANARYSVKK